MHAGHDCASEQPIKVVVLKRRLQHVNYTLHYNVYLVYLGLRKQFDGCEHFHYIKILDRTFPDEMTRVRDSGLLPLYIEKPV